MRTHTNIIKFEKSELIDMNCPLRHLEFSSIFNCQLQKRCIETKYPRVYSGLREVWVFFLMAVTSAPPAELSSQHHPLPENSETHSQLHLSKVSHPTDRRGECHHVTPLHIFSIVIASSRLKDAKVHIHTVLTSTYCAHNFLPAGCWNKCPD